MKLSELIAVLKDLESKHEGLEVYWPVAGGEVKVEGAAYLGKGKSSLAGNRDGIFKSERIILKGGQCL